MFLYHTILWRDVKKKSPGSIGQGHGNPLQGSVPPGVSAGPMGCGKKIGQGCVKSIVVKMKCVNGTYVDACNTCQCAKVRSVCMCVLGWRVTYVYVLL